VFLFTDDVNYTTSFVKHEMRYFFVAAVICGCQAQTAPMKPLSPPSQPQPVLILVLPSEPEVQDLEPSQESEFVVPGVYDGRPWDCLSKKDCPKGLVCCGQTSTGSACHESCDQGVWATLCENDDECTRPNFPGLKPDDPLCMPVDGPPGVQACIMG
jgi:hypothetical protein